MADNVLSKKRRLFIHSVGTGTINALLDDLLEDRVIRQEEMNKVRYENDTVMDQARVLIDFVIGKGSRACQKFITYLREEDPELAWKMRLHSESTRENLWADTPLPENKLLQKTFMKVLIVNIAFQDQMGRVEQDVACCLKNEDLWSQYYSMIADYGSVPFRAAK